uniref:DNA-directed DNA polymerase n=1 Tax=Fagus sylvatica TaxID=28930 RepID=A0A2N9J665_FAGSY
MGLSVLSHRRWCRSLIIQVGFFDFSFFETKFKGGGGLNLSHVNGGARKFVHQSQIGVSQLLSGGVAGALSKTIKFPIDRYQRVEKPKAETPIDENEIQINNQGGMCNYITYAMSLLHRAVTRYEGILSPVGPRGRLLRKLLSWIGLIPPEPETPYELDTDSNAPELYKSNVSDFPPSDTAVLSPDNIKGNPVPLKYVKFQNVRSLTIFIEDNQSDAEITKVQKIALFGTTLGCMVMPHVFLMPVGCVLHAQVVCVQISGTDEKLMVQVNKKYRCLEIDLDGLYKRMLLLKKKKYAAVKLQFKDGTPYEVQEDMRSGQVSLEKYIITKTLTKPPEAYPDAKNQPHVQVAQKLKQSGYSTGCNVGDTIPYIICCEQGTSSGSSTGIAQRARHPDELKREDGKWMIDIDYYLSQQKL